MEFTPPRLAELLLRWALGADDAEVVSGDLEEAVRARVGPGVPRRAAGRWYWRQVLSIVVARLLARVTDARNFRDRRLTMTGIRQDVVQAARALSRQPAFAGMAVAMLAIGIGATVAIFALANAVILKPLPYTDPERLMLVHLLAPQREGPVAGPTIWSYPKYRVFRDAQRSFDSSATFAPWNWNITGSDSPERANGELVDGSYFGVLDVSSPLGRTFGEHETRGAGTAPLVILSHRLWLERFGADTHVLGRTLGLNGTPHTIVGVMPVGFRGLTGQADLWVPVTTQAASELDEKWNHSYFVVARRKPGITAAQARSEAETLGPIIDEQIGSPNGDRGTPWSATAVPLDAERVDPLIRRLILLLFAAVSCVLLIVCVNLANLTLARSLARQRDVAIRLALGASRARIICHSMTESVLLAATGGVIALGVAYLLLSAGAALMPDLRAVLPRDGAAPGLTRVGLGRVDFDWATLLFTLLAAGGAATAFGLIPALRAARRDLAGTIKAGSSATTPQAGRGPWGRSLLIVGEIAVAFVLLTGAGLMLKSMARLQATDLGFRPAAIVSARIVLQGPRYSAERAPQFLEQLVQRLGDRGGVEAVAYASCAPLQGGCNGTMATFPDRPAAAGSVDPPVGVLWASPAYFETLGIRLVRGRSFTDRDRVGQPKVVVVNEAAARAFWPGADPIGSRIGLGQGGFQDGAEVVGVVADVRYGTADRAASPDVYLPILQSRRAFGLIFVKSRASTASVVADLRSDVRALDPDLPLTDIRTLSERVGESTWRTRMSAWLLAAFAALAVVLVALGVYAVVSQTVQQRTREIGLRVAMGAARRDILRLIVGRVVFVAVAGVGLGIALAVPSAKLLTALLHEVRPGDPWVFAPLALLLVLIALLAGYVPARRATGVDPLTTLRAE